MKKQRFDVTGMSCAACVANVERRVNKIDGVIKVEVSLLSNAMNVEYDTEKTNEKDIISAVCEIGYGASIKNSGIKEQNKKENSAESDRKNMLCRLIVSVILMIPLMYLAMGHMVGLPQPEFLVGKENALVLALTQMFICLAVLLVNKKFFISGSKALINRSPNMDTLVMIGSGASFIYGIAVIYRMAFELGHSDIVSVNSYIHDLYFESSAMILTLVSVGKYLEARAKAKTTSAIDKLIDLTPRNATVIRQEKETVIPVSEIVKRDILLVRPGDSIAVDGIVVSGRGHVDQSAVTGESLAVEKNVGDTVISATLNKNGSFCYEATKVGEETTIAQIIAMVEEAASTKAPIAKLADRISGVFVPVVIGISIMTFVLWLIMGYGFELAFSFAISVLVISCPCALGLATPVAIMVGTGKAASYGILIRSAEALEILHSINTVVFDKTGTITKGEPEVTDVECIKTDEAALLKYAYSLEKYSEHPLAAAICKYAEKKNTSSFDVTDFEVIPGRGVCGVADSINILGGNTAFMIESGIEITVDIQRYTKEGKTPLFFARDKELLGIIAVSDKLRDEAGEAVRLLKAENIKTVMLTGDNRSAALSVAKEADIDEVISDVMPADKEAVIRNLRDSGRKVAMVGDGINDAPALTRADVGIAIGAGTDIAIDSADIVLMKSDLLDVITAVRLSKKVINNIRMNLFWAFFYNVLGIPLAAGIFYIPFALKLDPMIGAVAMSLSSVCVVSNALRIYRFKKDHVKDDNKSKGEMKMEKIMVIEGMMCMHCKAHVEKALNAVEGVNGVSVELEAKTATVSSDVEIANELLAKAVTDAGYEVKEIR